MQRKHLGNMSLGSMLILALCLLLLLPSVSAAPASPPANIEEVVIVEEPTLTPPFGPICQTGWYGFDNNRGHLAYLTLNTNDRANPPIRAGGHPTCHRRDRGASRHSLRITAP